jgi:hypothetical protein
MFVQRAAFNVSFLSAATRGDAAIRVLKSWCCVRSLLLLLLRGVKSFTLREINQISHNVAVCNKTLQNHTRNIFLSRNSFAWRSGAVWRKAVSCKIFKLKELNYIV